MLIGGIVLTSITRIMIWQNGQNDMGFESQWEAMKSSPQKATSCSMLPLGT
jgi:hypothetical protein